MKNPTTALLLITATGTVFALNGCSLFHHHQQKFTRNPEVETGPMEPHPVSFAAEPREPQPLPLEQLH
jgi:hypothetical protein